MGVVFGEEQAARLLWRAGFGPAPGQAAELAKLGLDGAVRSLTRPASKQLVGPGPQVEGGPLAPSDAWGHDHLWWLDRMVRTQAPLVERMTLVWHDWFATSKSGVPQGLMLRQNALLRRHALGNFEQLALDITKDPAMLLWLNGTENNQWDVNENYARELQELFCLGAGRGYSERDVRQLARALTGFRNDWTDAGPTRFRYDRKFHDPRAKKIYGRRGKYTWQEGVRLVTRHRRHPEFMVAKLWGYFIAAAERGDDEEAGEALRRARPRRAPAAGGDPLPPRSLRPGKRMVKPPVVQAAGMLRAVGRGIDTPAWSWLCESAGQYLFMPPNVAGWDDTRWLDTATFRARWNMAQQICNPAQLDPETATDVPADPAELVRRAAAFWGSPALSGPVRAGLERYAADTLAAADQALDACELPRAGAQRAADARRHLPRLPDELSMDCCTEHARASAGLPAIEPGMPEPAGTGLSRRSFLLRGGGLGMAVYGAGKLAKLPAFETGVAAAQGAGPNTVLLSVFMDGGVDSLSLLAPVGDPHYRKLRPSLAVASGRAFAEDSRLDVAPGGERARRPARRGQGLRAARGRLHRRRPVALHVAPLLGGRRAGRQPALGLARPHAGRHRLARQPAPGHLARRPARALAGHRPQPGGGDPQARGLRVLDARRLGPGGGAARCRRSPTSGAR